MTITGERFLNNYENKFLYDAACYASQRLIHSVFKFYKLIIFYCQTK